MSVNVNVMHFRTLTLVAVLAAGCSVDSEPTQAELERAFLDANQGRWAGMISETPAIQKRVMRETPMLLVIPADTDENAAPAVEFPLLACKGSLSPAPPNSNTPFTETTGRFLLRISSGKPGGVCQPGPVRITRAGETLEYTFLGDTLRKISATLEQTP